MKILIADDERVARKILEAFLVREKYAVVLAEDGASALKCALTFTEPYIAILDWVMPGLSGPQVCVCLRSPKLKVRPYIIVLSARSGKGDIAAVLDAGADDFLTKPFNEVELLARLRVAARTLQYQTDLRQQIAQLEALAQRYNLLGEIVAQHGGRRLTRPPIKPVSVATAVSEVRPAAVELPKEVVTVPAKIAATPVPAKAMEAVAAIATEPKVEAGVGIVEEEAPPVWLPVELSSEETDVIMQQVLAELGFGPARLADAVVRADYHAADYTAWAGLILEREQVWIDLLLEVNASMMSTLFERSLGRRPHSEHERVNLLAETHTIISAAFKAFLVGKGAQVMNPILSQVMPTKDREVPVPSRREPHRYELAGGMIGLTIVRNECLLRIKPPVRLRNSDIMANSLSSPSVSEMALLSKGTVLTYRVIEKLAALEADGEERLSVPVFSTSRLAEYFIRDRS
jgi:CheY-like chemotaxis protein